jgi:asparagine N-glycosylation enzyme membrane subunit Stt3
MRVGIVIWSAYAIIAGLTCLWFLGVVVVEELSENGNSGAPFWIAVLVALSIPIVGGFLWFVFGSLRWIVSPKEF